MRQTTTCVTPDSHCFPRAAKTTVAIMPAMMIANTPPAEEPVVEGLTVDGKFSKVSLGLVFP
jgi:hypothetical protein